MIATDSSSFIAFIAGNDAPDTIAIEKSIMDGILHLPSPVVTELLSDPVISANAEHFINALPMLALTEGFWKRAGKSRSILLQLGLKAKLADALIAQSCIDHNVPLITRDKDFRHYATHCGLKLYA